MFVVVEVRLEIAWSHQDAAPVRPRICCVVETTNGFGVIHKESAMPRLHTPHQSGTCYAVAEQQPRYRRSCIWTVGGPDTWPMLACLFAQIILDGLRSRV